MEKLKERKQQPTEKALWRYLRPLLNANGNQAYRIEAINTPGFPDVVWITRRGVNLIELKAGRLKIRPQQMHFIRSASALGTTIFIIWQKESRGEVGVHLGTNLTTLHGPDLVFGPGDPILNWIRNMQ